jgi:hypothetical protein
VSAAARILGFAVALAVVLGASVAVGRAVDVAPRSLDESEEHGMAVGEAGEALPSGLSISTGGVTLVARPTTIAPGRPTRFSLRLEDDTGAAIRDLDVVHERPLHLIVVRRDLAGFQHLHPDRAPDGSWATSLFLDAPGSYRAFADFEVDGVRRTLGVDLEAPGLVEPAPRLEPSSTTRVGPYAVHLRRSRSMLSFRVERDGVPVLPEPYLGARGHLVVLREGDLAFVHAHPEPGATAADGTSYEAELPSAGRYAVFLQLVHDGVLRTAHFTIEERR